MNIYHNQIILASTQTQLGEVIQSEYAPAELIRLGKKAATTQEKIIQFFHHFVNIFKYGFEGAGKKAEEFFIRKSRDIIQDINLKQLLEKIKGVSPQEIMQYLGSLAQGEVLIETSPHWESIKLLHQYYRFLAHARTHLEQHWLKAFAHNQDVGPHLELIDPIVNKEQVARLLQLDQLQQSLTPHFNDILAFILNSGKLRNISEEQLDNFKLCLDLYNNLSSYPQEARLEKTKQLFTMLMDIEKSKGTDARNQFQNFLSSTSTLQRLVLQLLPTSVDTLIKVQDLSSQISLLPIDLAFSQTIDEIVQKLEDELPQNKQETLTKRLGPEFVQSYAALSEQDQATLDPFLKQLQHIEADYRLSGKSQEFLQSMTKAVEKGFKNSQELEQVIERLQSQNTLQMHLMKRLGDETRKCLKLDISPQQVREFQQQALKETELVTKQLLSKLIGGKKEIDEKFQAAVITFNQAQLEQAKQEWMSYGPNFVDSFLATLGPQVEKGLVHYKEMQTTSLEEVEKAFIKFKAHDLRLRYGPSLISHVMHYMLSPDGQELIKNNPDFLEQEWPSLLNNFGNVRQRFFEQGVTPMEFEELLNRFLTQSAYANAQNNHWLFLNDEPLEQFSSFLQHSLTEKCLTEMEQTHGRHFINSLRDYLIYNEPDILSGKQSFQESFFNRASSFSEQLRLLMPYIVANFAPLGVLDKEIISSSLLADPTPQNLIIRSNNLNQLKQLDKGYPSNSREIALIRELIRDLNSFNPPYLMDVDIDRQALTGAEKAQDEEQQKIVDESIYKLIKFCLKEIDEHQIYSPHILSQAVVELLKQKSNPQDPPLKRLRSIADKCDEFFNGSIKKDFHSLCFQLYIQDIAQKTCEAQSQIYNRKIAQLVEGFSVRFSKKEEGLQSPEAAKYIQDLIQFAVMLSLTTQTSNFEIFDALLSTSGKKHHIRFDVSKINKRAKNSKNPLMIPSDVKEQIINQVKSKSAMTALQSNDMIRAIQSNPFAIVEAFFPRFIENMLAPEDKAKVADIRQALIPLAPLFNQSSFVCWGVNALAQFTRFLPQDANPAVAKKFIVNKINSFMQLNIEELTKLDDRNKIRQAMDNKELDLVRALTEVISDKFFDTHAKIHQTSSDDVQKLAESDSVVDFICNTLPKLAEDQIDIQKWIKRIANVLPIIRTIGGGWIANKILTRYVSSKLNKANIDEPTKKLAAASMESIIQTVLLTIPSMIQQHEIANYLNFFDYLNKIMQKKEEPNQKELQIEILKLAQQLVKELKDYGPLLEEAINHAITHTASYTIS
jgi:hypothetical protein